MNFIKRIKSFSSQRKDNSQKDTIKFERHCPHCVSRRMFVFRLTSNQIKNPELHNEKN